ncbi:MAG: hypothetical protein WCR40_01180 [Candidatus Paceibacterota bacterium]
MKEIKKKIRIANKNLYEYIKFIKKPNKEDVSCSIRLLTLYNKSKIKEPKIDSTKLEKIKINIINNKKEKKGGNKNNKKNKDISIKILNDVIILI